MLHAKLKLCLYEEVDKISVLNSTEMPSLNQRNY